MSRKRPTPNATHAASPQPTLRHWFGVLAVFVGLLAQIVHTHSLPSGSARNHNGAVLTASIQSPDTCPLCIAMHSASSAHPPATSLAVHTTPLPGPTLEQGFISRPPAYAHFSRPPPHSSR